MNCHARSKQNAANLGRKKIPSGRKVKRYVKRVSLRKMASHKWITPILFDKVNTPDKHLPQIKRIRNEHVVEDLNKMERVAASILTRAGEVLRKLFK